MRHRLTWHWLKNHLRRIRSDPAVAFILLVCVLVAGNFAWVFLYTPGQTLWAFLAASRLAIEGAQSEGHVRAVDLSNVQASMSRFEDVYTTTIGHGERTRTFHTPEPLAEAGQAVSLLILPHAPNVFVPHIEGQGFWDRMQLLADVSIVKGVRHFTVHLVISAIALGAAAFGTFWLATHFVRPLLARQIIRQDERLAPMRNWMTQPFERIRNILFLLLYLLLLSMAFIELSRTYLDLALRAERLTALVTAGFVIVGIPFLIAAFYILRAMHGKELLPNLQAALADTLALFALGRGLYGGAGLLVRSLRDGETNLGGSMLDLLKRLVGV